MATISRSRLVGVLRSRIPHGAGTAVVAACGITPNRLSKALAQPSHHVRDFNVIAAHFGFEAMTTADGYYRDMSHGAA